MGQVGPRWAKNAPRAEGKAETGSVYRGCMFCPALCCFEFLWAALDYSGLLWAQGAALRGFGLHWDALGCCELLWAALAALR